MEDYDEELAAAIGGAEYYSTEMNAIYGYEITGVVTERTFATELIEKYNLPKFMAWNTGTRAEYDARGDQYVGFDSIEEMAEYIESESPSPMIEDEK